MILVKSLLSILCVFLLIPGVEAQDLTGLWTVESVLVDGQEVTPTGKWFKLNEDSTYSSGNGWLQSSEGTYRFDHADSTFTPAEKHGLDENSQPFRVDFEGEDMIWKRREHDMNVRIRLARASDLPKTPADKLNGLWILPDTTSAASDSTTQDKVLYYYFRWDRIYTGRMKDGEAFRGYWHMNGHRPELTLLPHREGEQPHSWTVSFQDEDKLIMTSQSEDNDGLSITLIRANKFPE
ncbi:MAG: hypothetical protein WBB45_11945 [Cyclobacteriaceae bacterium]